MLLKKDKECQKTHSSSHSNRLNISNKPTHSNSYLDLAKKQKQTSYLARTDKPNSQVAIQLEDAATYRREDLSTNRTNKNVLNTEPIFMSLRKQLNDFRFDVCNQINTARVSPGSWLNLRQENQLKPVIKLSMGSFGTLNSSRNHKKSDIQNCAYQSELASCSTAFKRPNSSISCYDQRKQTFDKFNKQLQHLDLKQRIKQTQKLAERCKNKIKKIKDNQKDCQGVQINPNTEKKDYAINHQQTQEKQTQCQLSIEIHSQIELRQVIKIKDKYIESLNATIQSFKESQQMASQNSMFEIQNLKKQLYIAQNKIEQLKVENQMLKKQNRKNEDWTDPHVENRVTQLQQKAKLSAEYEQKQNIVIQSLRDQVQTYRVKLLQQRQAHEAEIQQLRQSITNMQSSHSKQVSRLISQMQKSKGQQLSVSYRELGHSFQNKINQLLDENHRLKNTIANIEGSLQQLQIRNKSYEETIRAYEQRDQNCQSSGVIQQQMRQLRSQVQKLEEEKDALTDEYQMKIMKLQNEVDTIKSRKEDSGGNLNSIVKQQINQIEKLRAQLKNKTQQLLLLKKAK